MEKAVVLLSGGIDSATALYWAKKQGYYVYSLTIDMYDRSLKEQVATRQIAEKADIELIEISMPFLKEARDLVEEKYPIPYKKDFPLGYIPIRNLIFYSIAAYYAQVYGAQTIIGGHVIADVEEFPDVSLDFFKQLENLINKSQIPKHRYKIKLLMPFIKISKKEVLDLAIQLQVPLELTWSCYDSEEIPCGTCYPCVERAKAFSEANLTDPLISKNNQNKQRM